MTNTSTNGGFAFKYKKQMQKFQKSQASESIDDKPISKTSAFDNELDERTADIFNNFEIKEDKKGELTFKRKKKHFIIRFLAIVLFYTILSILLIGTTYIGLFVFNPSLALEIISEFFKLISLFVI